jgi:hypothetical protein
MTNLEQQKDTATDEENYTLFLQFLKSNAAASSDGDHQEATQNDAHEVVAVAYAVPDDFDLLKAENTRLKSELEKKSREIAHHNRGLKDRDAKLEAREAEAKKEKERIATAGRWIGFNLFLDCLLHSLLLFGNL